MSFRQRSFYFAGVTCTLLMLSGETSEPTTSLLLSRS